MGTANIDEFNAAVEGEQALRPFLDNERAEMLKSTPEGLREVLSSLLPPVDAKALSGTRAKFVHASFVHGLESGVDGWLDDDLAFTRGWGFDLATIAVPVLIMQGEQDLMVPFAHGTWLAEHVAGAQARLSSDEGHVSLAEKYADVHAWLLSHV
jgi:pimeloyl-ACP methyl ester carboxylesterase